MPIYYGSEVTGFAQDDTGVDVELSDGRSLRAEYLVGCDGGRSLIRKAAGIEFPGWGPTTSRLIAEVEGEELAWGLRRDALGIHSLSRMGDGVGETLRHSFENAQRRSGWAATCWVSREIDQTQVAVVGGRARTWGSFRGSKPPRAGWLCVTTDAFQRIMAEAPSIDDRLDRLSRLKPDDREAIRALSAEIRRIRGPQEDRHPRRSGGGDYPPARPARRASRLRRPIQCDGGGLADGLLRGPAGHVPERRGGRRRSSSTSAGAGPRSSPSGP